MSAIVSYEQRSCSHGAVGSSLTGRAVRDSGHFGFDFFGFNMELSDRVFSANRDWDPSYLKYIFSQDFYEFRELWTSNVGDTELIEASNASDVKRYSPVVEDISMDDDTLYEAVSQIENE